MDRHEVADLARQWGISPDYVDANGQHRQVETETLLRIIDTLSYGEGGRHSTPTRPIAGYSSLSSTSITLRCLSFHAWTPPVWPTRLRGCARRARWLMRPLRLPSGLPSAWRMTGFGGAPALSAGQISRRFGASPRW